MTVHGDRIGDVEDLVATGLAPPGVVIILSILEVLAEASLLPDWLSQAAADHAEEVIPMRGFALGAEAAVVVAGEDGLTVGPGDLAAEAGGDFLIHQGFDERSKPVVSLWGGVGIEEDADFRLSESHAVIHDTAWIVFLGGDLDEVGWICGANEVLGAIGAATVDDDEFPPFVILGSERRQGLLESPRLIVAAHDNTY